MCYMVIGQLCALMFQIKPRQMNCYSVKTGHEREETNFGRVVLRHILVRILADTHHTKMPQVIQVNKVIFGSWLCSYY